LPIGMTSMGPLFEALGIYCVMIEDADATASLKNGIKPRNLSFVRSAPSIIFTLRHFKKIGALGGRRRKLTTTKAQRVKWAKRGAMARWRSPSP
jgi:hypothetical protein